MFHDTFWLLLCVLYLHCLYAKHDLLCITCTFCLISSYSFTLVLRYHWLDDQNDIQPMNKPTLTIPKDSRLGCLVKPMAYNMLMCRYKTAHSVEPGGTREKMPVLIMFLLYLKTVVPRLPYALFSPCVRMSFFLSKTVWLKRCVPMRCYTVKRCIICD